MRKQFLVLGLACWTLAAAQGATLKNGETISDPELCKSVKVFVAHDSLALYWTQPGKFPNPKVDYYSDGKWTVNCPDKQGSWDSETGIGTFKTDGLAALLSLAQLERSYPGSPVPTISLLNWSYYRYPNLRTDWRSYSVGLSFEQGKIKTVGEPEMLSIVAKNVTAGYKTDSKPLSPLFFEGKLSPIEISPNDKTIDIYVMPSEYTKWQRVTLNFANNTLTIYKKSEFPKE